MKFFFSIGFVLLVAFSGISVSWTSLAQTNQTEEEIAKKVPLKTAIFVRNRGGKSLTDKIDTFSDELSARLSEKGFAVMDWKDVIQKFREANEPEEEIYNNVRSLMLLGTGTGTTGSVMATSSETVSQGALGSNLAVQGKSGGIANASALRIAQMLDADYIIVASIGQIGHETRTFKGEGTLYQTNNTADIYSMPLTVKVLEGSSGQSIYGDTVTVYEKILQNPSISISVDNIPDRLIDSGTKKLAENITDKVSRIRDTIVKARPTVPFSIECNVPGTAIELDGAVIGSAPGNFNAAPGIHQIRVSREHFVPWERTVNILPNQKINVTLELTTEGLAKYKDITAFNQEQALQKLERESAVDIAKEQSKADAESKVRIATGIETSLKNSYIRSEHFQEGLTSLVRIGDGDNTPIVPIVPPTPPAPPAPLRP
ncbi:MAG: PEGA domain-containing protein [Candidatus Nanoarchaeia archaeon]